MYIREINVNTIDDFGLRMPTAVAEIVTNDRYEINTLRDLMVGHNNVTVVRKDVMDRAELTFIYARSGVGRSYALQIKEVIFNEPATIVYWTDGTKTVVKCSEDDEFDKEKGIALCFMKKAMNNKSNYNNVFKEWIK